MNWKLCIDSPQQRALKLCRGSMDKGDGYGVGYGNVNGYGWGNGNGYGRASGGGYGDGYGYGTPDGGGYGSGYGLDGDRGAPDGGSPAEWR